MHPEPGVTLVPTGITLYDKSNLPVYLQRQNASSWSLNAPVGIYNLEVKTHYAPSSGDTATFVDKIRIKDRALDLGEVIHKNLFNSDLEKFLPRK